MFRFLQPHTQTRFWQTVPVGKILLIFLVWRMVLFGVGAGADSVLEYDPTFPYSDSVLASSDLPRWIYSWANFDGVHYLKIAESGYVGTGLIQAFFPVYPGLLNIFNLVVQQPIAAGLLVSNLSTIGFLLVLHYFVSQKYSKRVAWTALGVALLFPTSFFMGAVYTESLYVLLALLGMLGYTQRNWTLMIVSWSLATATRLVGIFLPVAAVIGIVALLAQHTRLSNSLEMIRHSLHISSKLFRKQWLQILDQISQVFYYCLKLQKAIREALHTRRTELLYIAASGVGLLAYMTYLYMEFGDPLYFFHVQQEFGGGRQESIILLPQVIWRYLKMLVTYQAFDLRYFAIVQEFIVAIGAFTALFVWRKKFTAFEWWYCLFALLIPTLTGTFSSMPRYVLAAVPLIWVCADVLSGKKWWLIGAVTISSILLIVNTILFVQGYWIS